MFRKFLILIPMLLPGFLKKAWYRTLLGYRIGRNVRIGCCYLDARHLEIGDGTRLGHFNIVRGVKHLAIGRGCYLGNSNHFLGVNYPDWASRVVIGDRCAIMSRHLFDAAGTLTIGAGTTLAGRETQLWTHTVAFVDGKTELKPLDLTLGAECYVGARCMILFCAIPAGTFIGAGSVVTKSFEASPEGRILIAGNPAMVRKVYPGRTGQ